VHDAFATEFPDFSLSGLEFGAEVSSKKGGNFALEVAGVEVCVCKGSGAV
jgi:hypothetical protein